MSRLTPNQKGLLLAADRRYRDGRDLAERVGYFAQTGKPYSGSIEGLHQTAASLVRKGLLEKVKLGGVVHYQITDAGSAARNP